MEDIKNSPNAEERICRICHGGPEDGKLISPCLCKGSMKYVHKECLNHWRSVAQNQKSFFQCDQCHFKYHFRRTDAARILSSWWALHVLTLLAFVVFSFLGGFLTKLLGGLWSVDDSDSEWDWSQFFTIDLYHFLSGVILIGAAGLIQLSSMIGLRRAFFLGDVGFHRGGGDRSNCEAIFIAILIGIGLVKSIASLYRLVERWSQKALNHAEFLVENIQTDDDPSALRPQARPASSQGAAANNVPVNNVNNNANNAHNPANNANANLGNQFPHQHNAFQPAANPGEFNQQMPAQNPLWLQQPFPVINLADQVRPHQS